MSASSSLFSKETFVHAVSGALGSVTAMTLILPLDTVRSRMLLDDSAQSKIDNDSSSSKRFDETDTSPNKLSGKIGKTKEELVQTFQTLLPDDSKTQSKQNSVHKKELQDCHKSDADSVFQLLLRLIRNEGVSSLFRGAQSTLICVAVSNFVYFYAFNSLKRWSYIGGQLNNRGPKSPSALRDLLFACAAGVANVLITNPIWVVNSRLKMQGIHDTRNKSSVSTDNPQRKYKGLIDGLLRIGYHEGVQGVWAGTIPSLILVSQPALKFTIYEFLKRYYLESYANKLALMELDRSLSAKKTFLIGALANAIATLITYPVQVVQAKMRHGGKANKIPNTNGVSPTKVASQKDGMIKTTIYLIRTFGPTYLYRGLDAKLIQSFVTAGFMFSTYEKMSAILLALLLPTKNTSAVRKIS